LEGIISLNPDIVIGLKEHSVFADKYKQSKRQILLLNHKTVTGILSSFEEIADYCGIKERGFNNKNSLTNELNLLKAEASDTKPSVLLTVGRSADTPSSRSFFISGKDGFYDELINYAGGKNVISDNTIFSGTLSAESLIALNPDIIIEILGKDSANNLNADNIKKSWSALNSIKAV
jgi:iron complex transport system substrate-binding protein